MNERERERERERTGQRHCAEDLTENGVEGFERVHGPFFKFLFEKSTKFVLKDRIICRCPF
jgi:hypothetical protein